MQKAIKWAGRTAKPAAPDLRIVNSVWSPEEEFFFFFVSPHRPLRTVKQELESDMRSACTGPPSPPVGEHRVKREFQYEEPIGYLYCAQEAHVFESWRLYSKCHKSPGLETVLFKENSVVGSANEQKNTVGLFLIVISLVMCRSSRVGYYSLQERSSLQILVTYTRHLYCE